MRLKIGDKTYTAAALDRISLRNLIKLEAETVELGRPMRWTEIQALMERVQALDPGELETDPDCPWFIGLLIWAARLEAGEVITFSDAIDFPMSDLDFLPDPGEEVSAPDPRPARPASGRAIARQPADRKPKAKASKRASTGA